MIALAAALLAVAGTPHFAPPQGRAIRFTEEQRREDPRVRRHFVTERQVTFTAEPGGYRADVLTLAVRAEPEDGAAANFRRVAGAFLGKTIRFHLDHAGKVVSIDDETNAWTTFTSGMATIRPKANTPPLPSLDDVPPESRRAALGSFVTPIVAVADLSLVDGEAPATVSSAQTGGRATLSGTRRVKHDGGDIVVDTDAGGDQAGTVTTLRRTRRSDTATGLLREEREEVVIRAAGLEQKVTSAVRVY
jgi:hypothetical protein